MSNRVEKQDSVDAECSCCLVKPHAYLVIVLCYEAFINEFGLHCMEKKQQPTFHHFLVVCVRLQASGLFIAQTFAVRP